MSTFFGGPQLVSVTTTPFDLGPTNGYLETINIGFGNWAELEILGAANFDSILLQLLIFGQYIELKNIAAIVPLGPGSTIRMISASVFVRGAYTIKLYKNP